ncbi:hypothetical protein EJ02DRAFT_514954 [Clathrospora elynae]|uniref:Developmental regulatory protein wetA n=1 Tax=Clathrospora elynae TaxID=706981 RepID=A0A6A5SB26_9PLEO|nr:hypothetical protein EJ02DRAFT_514954 [Clathrospora elynae]
MRSISDKEMNVDDVGRLFEEYVETDLLNNFSDSPADQSSFDDLAHLVELPSSSNGIDMFGIEPILDRDDDAWHKALQKYKQDPASFIPSADSSSSFQKIDSNARKSHTDSELLSLEYLFEAERNQLRSLSQPSTPRPHHTAGRSVRKAVSFISQLTHRGISRSSKKSPAPSSSFAKMIQPSYYRSPISDVWTRKIDSPADSFHLRESSHGISSSPPSSKLVQHENGSGFSAQDHYQAYTNDQVHTMLLNDESDFSNYQLTPQASPAIGISNNNGGHFNDNVGLAFSSSTVSSCAALSALETPLSSLRLPMTTWDSDASPSLDFGFSASPDYDSTSKISGWWNANDDAAQSCTSNYSHSRTTSQNMGAAMDGLVISCDCAAFGSNAGEAMVAPVHETSADLDMGQYAAAGAMYPTPPYHHHNANMGSITYRPLSRSPSPRPQPHFHRCRSFHQSHHHATTSSTPSRRKSSTNSSATHSRQPSLSGAGFVNFTPDDSRKILTGVAPSGSSKTKARREREAADKRRKLSQAAVKAVLDAGGDVDSLRRLEREGLFEMER